MNTLALSYFQCPLCAAPLHRDLDGGSCRCQGARTHCFDFSRSGYLNLCTAHGAQGDGKAAVRARRLFLEAGYYAPLSQRINQILNDLHAKSVLDAGCGEGYYTNRMAAMGRTVLGIDLSKDGIDLGAKTAKRAGTDVGFAVASLFSIPIGDEQIDVVTNLFAPCAEEEFCRILKPQGHLLLVGAGARHLFGLKQALYDNPYQNLGRADLPQGMRQVAKERLTFSIRVERKEHIEALFSMTPYYWRTSAQDRQKLESIEHLSTEVDFDIFLFSKNADGHGKGR